MARPLWNGSISFGLVNIPVKLFRAQAAKDVRFHQIHASDGARVQQKRWCPAEDAEIPYNEIVKGYEIGPDQYVVVEPEELARLDPAATHEIDISDFVDLDQIDPVYFERAYHVVPGERAAKAYSLLVAAMEQSHKVGIAKFVMRTKEYLCAIRPRDGALVLETMYFADEVLDVGEVGGDQPELDSPKPKELAMAVQLVESLAGDFEPEQYRDEYRHKVMELIETKAQGGEAIVQPETETPAPIVDLMEALQASLKRPGKGQDAEGKTG